MADTSNDGLAARTTVPLLRQRKGTVAAAVIILGTKVNGLLAKMEKLKEKLAALR